MFKPTYLTKKQKGVLEDLFSTSLTVQEILEKWKVRRPTYDRWHSQDLFAAEFKRRLKLMRNESDLIFARYSVEVAMKLVSLTAAQKDEIARKACLDVINHYNRKPKTRFMKKPQIESKPKTLPPDVASRMLAFLTEEKKRPACPSKPSAGGSA